MPFLDHTAKRIQPHSLMNTWTINGQEMNETQVVAAILAKDNAVTESFMYRICRPLFTSVFSKYHTGCACLEEFVSEIYLYIVEPRAGGNGSRLAAFGFRCSLPMWLKVVAENYCRRAFSRRVEYCELISAPGDRKPAFEESIPSDDSMHLHSLARHDVDRLLEMMPNERYRRLIRLRYVDELSHEETARTMQMEMANYYNRHLLAKRQFMSVLKADGII